MHAPNIHDLLIICWPPHVFEGMQANAAEQSVCFRHVSPCERSENALVNGLPPPAMGKESAASDAGDRDAFIQAQPPTSADSANASSTGSSSKAEQHADHRSLVEPM